MSDEQYRTTSLHGPGLGNERRAPKTKSAGPIRTARALVRLARARHQLKHRPTLGQIRALSYYDGQQPQSHLVDVEIPFVGYDDCNGQYALAFACRGTRDEPVQVHVLADGLFWANGEPAA